MHKKLRTTGLFLASSGLLVAAALGCSPPPDTSPAVSITSPVNEQTVTAGEKIDVRFTVSGIDESGAMPVAFQLSGGATQVPGRGKVRAFIDQSTFLAQTTKIPDDANPFFVPDGITGLPQDFVKPGKHKITLILFYNDSADTKVQPQREGTVTINVQ